MADARTFGAALRTHAARPDVVPQALDELEAFFLKAERGRYGLEHPGFIDVGATASAIWRATRRDAKRFSFAPACAARARPEWSASEAAERSLAVAVGRRLYTVYGSRSTPERMDPLMSALETRLLDPLRRALATSLAGGVDDAAFALAWNNVAVAIGAYVAAVATADERADDLVPLVRALATHVPLVEREDKDGSWLLLTA